MINEGLLPSTQSGTKRLAELSPEQSAYVDILAGAKFYARNLVDWNEVTRNLIANEQEIFAGNMTAQEALDATQAEIG